MNTEDLYAILHALPSKHRKALIDTNRARTKGAKNNRERLQKIADALGVEGVAPYRELYIEGNGRLFTWYVGRDVALTQQQIREQFLARYERPMQGERPEVGPEEDPRFHLLEQRGDQLRLEYAYFGSMMEIPNGWDYITARRFRRCTVVVRENPFTLELRRVPTGMREALLRSLCLDLGIAAERVMACLLTTEAQRSLLERALDAVPQGIRKVGRGRGLGTLSITTDGSISLLEQIDFQGLQGAHHEIYQRSWTFLTRHDDGYMEKATYSITIESGDMRVSEGSSEVAIENLRRNAVALF